MLLETPTPDAAVSKLAPVRAAVPQACFNWRHTIEFLLIVAQLALLAVLIDRYKLESPAFIHLSFLAFAGFVVNYFLPLAYRLQFFLALSLSSIVMVLGWESSAWLIGIGLVLLGVCHLPVLFSVRLTILTVIVALIAAMRVDWIPAPIPAAVWPVLASMFMFRLIVYLYHLRFQSASSSIASRLSYFFMLPNVCFPFFPVVDYAAYVRGYYDEDRHRIHLVGARWIFRGIIHLILYRMIYKEWGISLNAVANAGDLLHYCLWLFLMYLHVSGQFHVIVGMLHLFGFNLPETNNLYYLSSSFTDFWRRINIYWKDFIMKILFYPTFFRLRRFPQAVALVVSTLVAFFFTWLLHALQWFWLMGSFWLVGHDILFWTILTALVVVNTLWELKFGRKRTLGTGNISWRAAIIKGLKTFATFTVICILWSMWNSKSIAAWRTLWQFALVPPTASGWLLICATAVSIIGGAMLITRYPAGFPWSRLSFVQESAGRCVMMCLLAGVSINAVNRQLGGVGKWIMSAKSGELNAYDMADLEHGYYEDLLDVRGLNGELWKLYSRRPRDWEDDLLKAGYAQRRGGMVNYELKPSIAGKFKGARLQTNQWGMHDDEYSRKRPPGCYRIAILGSSNVMASGVTRDEDFETLVENRLNRENSGKPYSSYEILNFAVAGYNPLSQIWVLKEKVLDFEPDAVFYVGHANDQKRAAYNLMARVHGGIDLPDPYLRELCRRADIDRDTAEEVMQRRLTPFGEELYAWTLHKMADICKDKGISPVFILMPVLGSLDTPESDLRLAGDAGFTVVDLSGAFGKDYWNKKLWITEWDGHPNPTGHRMIANRLYDLLRRDQVIPVPTAHDAGN